MAPRTWNPTITVSPNVKVAYGEARVTVYRDKRGDVYVRPYGAPLTASEKRKGLSRARGRFARSIQDFYSNPDNLGFKLKFTKSGSGIERTKNLMPASIDGQRGWFDIRNGKFLFKEQRSGNPNYRNAQGEVWTQYGTTQLNLRSCDNTAYGLTRRASLEEFYLTWLDAKEKARLNEALSMVDWQEDVYAHFITSDPDEIAPAGRPNLDEEKRGYDHVLNVIKETVGAKWSSYTQALGGE